MHFSLRKDWRDLKRGRPGHRFQDRYERTHRCEPHCSTAKRIATIVVAVVVMAVALFFAVFPGPAIPFFFIGGALLATQSRVIARWMDWIELRVRKVVAWLKRHWRRLPLAGRVVVVAIMVSISATMMFFSYRFLRG
jgi:hypothetical protein